MMAGALSLPLPALWQYTYRQLSICYESWLLHQWDLNSSLAYRLENVQKSFSAKEGTKASTFAGVHPYRKESAGNRGPGELVIHPKNIGVLKGVLASVMAQR